MGDTKETIAKTAIRIAGAAGAAAGAAGLIPSVNDPKPSPIPTKEERSLASIQDRERKERIKEAQKKHR